MTAIPAPLIRTDTHVRTCDRRSYSSRAFGLSRFYRGVPISGSAMSKPQRARQRVRRAYEFARIAAAARALALAVVLFAVAVALYRATEKTALVAGILAATLAALAWRGGAWRRGSLAGVLVGIPALIVPALVASLASDGHCARCDTAPALPYTVLCFALGSPAGLFVARRSLSDRAPFAFAMSALAASALTGLLGCATIGFGGVAGVIIGVTAGSVTGWVAGHAESRRP